MYRPSIHLFKGTPADAEVVIQHSGGGKNLLVCIPVVVQNSTGPSSMFFSQIMSYIPSTENEPQVVNVSNWSLNQLLNYNVPYYYYLGSFPFEPCNGKVDVIVYDLKNSAKITHSDMSMLSSAITDTANSTIANPKNGLLIYNNKGAEDPENKGGDFDIVNCVPIDGMDDGTGGTGGTSVKNSSGSSNSIFNKINTKNETVMIIGLILAGLFLIFSFVYLIMPWLVHKFTGTFSGSGASGG